MDVLVDDVFKVDGLDLLGCFEGFGGMEGGLSEEGYCG